MAKKVVTLYVDDTSLRLLEARGKQVKKWADLPLGLGLISDGVVLDEEKVVAKIKELFEDQKMKAQKVILGLSGLHCLSQIITLPILPKAMIPEAVRQEAERDLPVPLEQLYLSLQVISDDGKEMRVFLAAIPRSAADTIIKAIRKAGVEPYLIDLKPLALARVLSEATAINIDAQTAEFDITVMVDGIPQPIRTVPFPNEMLSLQEKLSIIREELERTIKFYNSSHPEEALESSLTIYISGELADEPELCQSLSSELEYSVSLLSSPLKFAESLIPGRYMVNIGLALKELSLGKGTSPSVVNLNILPEVHRFTAFSVAKVLIMPAVAVIAIGSLVPLVMTIQSVAADTASLEAQVVATNQIFKQKHEHQQALVGEITKLEGKVAGMESANDTFTAVLDYFDKRHEMVNGDLMVAASVLPDDVDLGSIAYANDVLSISGTAPSEVEVLAYADALRASDRFSPLIITNIVEGEEGVGFVLTLGEEECEEEE